MASTSCQAEFGILHMPVSLCVDGLVVRGRARKHNPRHKNDPKDVLMLFLQGGGLG
jgi:hypothetical protein